MPHVHVRVRSLSLRRALAQALVASLIPVGTAFAQSAPLVRTTRDETTIMSSRHANGMMVMIAPRGTVLEVIHTQGDRNSHRDFNEYWVLVPPDSWGTQRVGWISGRDVEHAPSVPRAKAAAATPIVTRSQPAEAPSPAPPPAAAPIAVGNVPAKRDLPAVSEAILRFEFAKSDLTPEAQGSLAQALEMLKGDARGVSFALEGHADWVGSEGFNEKLGLARAETVKRHLAEQHKIPVDQISVVSYGESRPATTNATSEGRAQNRRVVVVVKVEP